MQITEKRLRTIIKEELSRKTAVKAYRLIRDITEAADQYLKSISMKSDSPSKYHEVIKESSEELVALARWMLSRREIEGETVAKFAKVATDLTKLSGFWNRPTFFKKDSYLNEVEATIKRLKAFQREAQRTLKPKAA